MIRPSETRQLLPSRRSATRREESAHASTWYWPFLVLAGTRTDAVNASRRPARSGWI